MNNIKNINQIPANIYDAFEKDTPLYLVKGIVKNAQGNYQNVSFHVKDRDELNFQIAPDQLVRHRVFEIGKVVGSEPILKMEAKEFMKIKEKEKRLAQYLELKKEFETLPIAEETLTKKNDKMQRRLRRRQTKTTPP